MAVIGGNSGRYTLCPFYKWDREARITCEDTYRHFESLLERCAWMDMYCDNEWMKCPFAMDLTEAYAKLEKGDESALENQKIEAMQKELKSMSTKLGMAEKKLERLQKKLDEEKELNKSWQRQHEEDEKKKKMFFSYWKDSQAEMDEYERHEAERYGKLAQLYEDRLAYLISEHCGGRLEEKTVKEWAEGKEYAITFDEKESEPVWIVVFKEDTEGEEDEPEGISENDRPEA